MNDHAHAQFLASLDASTRAVFVVGRWFHLQGVTVEVPGLVRAASWSEHRRFADRGDLFISRAGGRRRRIEVKNPRKENFTGSADWPHDYALVASSYSVARAAGEPPVAYFIVNRALTDAAVVRWSTRESWFEVSNIDPKTGRRYLTMACPNELLQWRHLEMAG